MNNTVDLVQIFSVRAGKNRADIRMALDALELAFVRPQIDTYVIVSGDSDFGPLAAKLREYGKYTLGIGPRDVTHPLLASACDEFVYIETTLGELGDVSARPAEGATTDGEPAARALLLRALEVHDQRGELPVLAAKLKQTMLLLERELQRGQPRLSAVQELAGGQQRPADPLRAGLPALRRAQRVCGRRLGYPCVGRSWWRQRPGHDGRRRPGWAQAWRVSRQTVSPSSRRCASNTTRSSTA